MDFQNFKQTMNKNVANIIKIYEYFTILIYWIMYCDKQIVLIRTLTGQKMKNLL